LSDVHARRGHISDHRGAWIDPDGGFGCGVAFQQASDEDRRGPNVAVHLSVGLDGQFTIDFDRAFDDTADHEIALAFDRADQRETRRQYRDTDAHESSDAGSSNSMSMPP